MRSSETLCCPVCNGKLSVSGSRSRKLIDEDGSEIKLIIRRMKCQGCGRIHHELPDCIVPYKRCCTELIALAVSDHAVDADTFPGENSTLVRLRVWFKLLREYVSRVREHYLLLFKIDLFSIKLNTVGGLKRIVRILANSNLWPQTRLALTVQT